MQAAMTAEEMTRRLAAEAPYWRPGTSVGYHGFKGEHVRGHHVHVSTPEDASTG